MKTFEFDVALALPNELTEQLADRLYSTGCEDATCVQSAGVVKIGFSRESVDLESAIRSAIGQVMQAGCTVARVQIESDMPLLQP